MSDPCGLPYHTQQYPTHPQKVDWPTDRQSLQSKDNKDSSAHDDWTSDKVSWGHLNLHYSDGQDGWSILPKFGYHIVHCQNTLSTTMALNSLRASLILCLWAGKSMEFLSLLIPFWQILSLRWNIRQWNKSYVTSSWRWIQPHYSVFLSTNLFLDDIPFLQTCHSQVILCAECMLTVTVH